MARSTRTPGSAQQALAPVQARVVAHLQARRLQAAEAELGPMLLAVPDWAEGHHLSGLVAQAAGQLAEARTRFERAIRLNPKVAAYHANMAVVLLGLGDAEGAVTCCLTALRRDPRQFGAMMNLGLALTQLNKPGEALDSFERALTLKADFAPLHANIGRLRHRFGEYELALAAYRRAAALAPEVADYALGQATNLYMLGRTQEAADILGQAVTRWPENLQALSAHAFILNYFDQTTPQQQADAARAYGAALAKIVTPITHVPDAGAAERRLRVGMVSADLRDHSVTTFLSTLLPRLDPAQFDLVAYSTSRHADAKTEMLKQSFAEWVDAAELSHAQLAERIQADRIDVLFDLSGHTLGQRLPVFARKPAPVSASWLGYSGTTGVEAIDYLVCDAVVVPPGEEAMISETPWRLPESMVFFPDGKPVTAPPRGGGPFTFGSFNSHNKLSDATLASWAEILRQVPESRLLLKSRALESTAEQEATRGRFAALGVAAGRLTLLGRTETVEEHLALYGQIDIALDPFPYNGTTTTMQALRMGVPVLALAGDRFIGRLGASILAHAGMSDWIAGDREAYVALAVRWARDSNGLAAVRAALPDRVAAAPIADADRFAQQFGAMIRAMWRIWCASDKSASSP